MKPGDLVMSKDLQRLGGAIRSRLESYRLFEGIATVVDVSNTRKGSEVCIVMLDSGKSISTRSSSLEKVNSIENNEERR